MHKIVTLLSLILLVSVLSGCSSIVSKSDYAVAISSSPQSASFLVIDKQGREIHRGVTPETITLSSSSGYFSGATYTIKFTKEGYQDRVFTLRSNIDGWYFGNLPLSGLGALVMGPSGHKLSLAFGLIVVDPATGSMYKLPKRVDVSLGNPISYVPEKISLASIDDLSEDQRSRLVLVKEN